MSITRGISYAEGDLQVHQIHEDTQELMNLLEGDYQTRAGLETESRKLASDLERRKLQIINDRVASVSDESIAAHERAVKLLMHNDIEYQQLVDRSNEIMAHRDAISAVITSRENNLKGHVARMNLLGGYLTFLGSLKDGENIAELKKHTASPF